MNSKKLWPNRIVAYAAFVLLLLSTWSCVDNKYDLNKDINLEMNIGGSELSIPIGSTDSIMLKQLFNLKEGDILQAMPDGKYAIQQKDSFDVDVPNIDPLNITVQDIKIEAVTVEFTNPEIDVTKSPAMKSQVQQTIPVQSIPGNTLNETIKLTDDIDFRFEYRVPEGTVSIDTVYFGDGINGQKVVFSLDLRQIHQVGLTNISEKITEYTVDFPKGFGLVADPSSIGSIVKNSQTGGVSYKVTNYNIPQGQTVLNFSFYVKSFTGIEIDHSNPINVLSKSINYSLTYGIQANKSGVTANPTIAINVDAQFQINNIVVTVNKTAAVNPDPSDVIIDEQVNGAKLVGLDQVILKNDAVAELTLAIEGLPSNVDVIFDRFIITFPDFIDFKTSQVVNHQLNLEGKVFSVNKKLLVRLPIGSFTFSENPIRNNGTQIYIDKQILINGYVSIKDGQISSDELKNVKVIPSFSIPVMNVASIVGKVDPDISIDPQSVDMSDLPDFLTQKDVQLDLKNPHIVVQVKNDISVPVNVSAVLQSYRNNSPINETIKTKFRIQGAATSGVVKESNIWIADSDAGMPAGYIWAAPEDGKDLAGFINKTVPDRVNIDMTAAADLTTNHEIVLDKSYTMNVKYDVTVPLEFGDALNIVYSDTIDNLQKDLGDFLDKVNQLVLIATVRNTVPLNFKLSGKAVDMGDKALEIAIDIPDEIKAGAVDGSAIDTKFNITLKETKEGELKKLDALILNITADAKGTVGGAALNENQFLHFYSIKAKVPGGINLDLND